MLPESEIGQFYLDNPIRVPHFWNLGRKHLRISLRDGRFVKLNHYENRLNEKDLRFYCYKLKSMHVYFSVLNWLFMCRLKSSLSLTIFGGRMLQKDGLAYFRKRR